ncbi:type IV fimbrial biogenesis protein PilY1 [Psychrobacter sp. JCM 18902]|nr:type IV fimbrial biogenesis protein PilY1 [Psychrobacter sp. JCM 18902]
MVNAQTGELIWSTSSAASSGKNVKIDSMINSITGGITVLDRDNDGLIDHIYAADLGGQVFRADFENARIEQFGFTAVNSFANKGVTRILNVAPTNKKLAYRFYESPIVSFFRRESGPDNGKLFAMVNVISGNRSAPLSILRDNNAYANRVYGIIDNDVTHADLFKSGFSKTIADLTEAKLVNLGDEIPKIASQTTDPTRKAKKDAAIAAMIGKAQSGGTAAVQASKNGWYYPLTRFDGYSNVRYNKGIGDSVVINNLLYTSVYNPDKIYGNTASCTAKITGGSERQIYCLPYGVCMENTSISGTGGFVLRVKVSKNWHLEHIMLTILMSKCSLAQPLSLTVSKQPIVQNMVKTLSKMIVISRICIQGQIRLLKKTVMAHRLSIYSMSAIPCSQKHGTSASSRYSNSHTFAKYHSYDYKCHPY